MWTSPKLGLAEVAVIFLVAPVLLILAAASWWVWRQSEFDGGE